MARITNAQVMAELASLRALLQAQAPVTAKGAPARSKAKSPKTNDFVTYLQARAIAQTGVTPAGFEPCSIHAPEACNRSFRHGSRGIAQHEARVNGAAS